MLSNTCQQFNVLGSHPLQYRAWQDLRRSFGVRSNLRRVLSPPPPLGEPSQYKEGEWVQVRSAAEIESTLEQIEALKRAGFERIAVYSLDTGTELTQGEIRCCADRWLYYLCS